MIVVDAAWSAVFEPIRIEITIYVWFVYLRPRDHNAGSPSWSSPFLTRRSSMHFQLNFIVILSILLHTTHALPTPIPGPNL